MTKLLVVMVVMTMLLLDDITGMMVARCRGLCTMYMFAVRPASRECVYVYMGFGRLAKRPFFSR